VLRLGFGAMLLLLLVSAFEAYRIQDAASRRTTEIYHRFVQKGNAMAHIRRCLFLGSIHARDFLLSDRPDRAVEFQDQMRGLKLEVSTALDELEFADAEKQPLTSLRTNIDEFWGVVSQTLRWSDEERNSQAFAFVQSEIVPRRNAAGALLRELTAVNESGLRNSEAEFDRSRTQTLLWLSAMVAVCVLLGIAIARFSLSYAARLERQSQERFEQVVQAKKDLENLSARLLDIQEDERRRLSRELHDEIGQALTALRIEISHAQSAWKTGSPATAARLDQARSLAEKTVQTVRNISLLLRPSLLDDLGLGPALQWQLEDFSRRSGIRCSFKEDGLRDDLPDPLKTCVYRVVQETLNNCEKHSAATEVRIAVRQTPAALNVHIEDNGRGFVVSRTGNSTESAGLGILGMRERIAAVGGSLHLESAQGSGTRIRMVLPLGPAHESGADDPAKYSVRSMETSSTGS
jgi:signal transduction histidine kinase